VKLDPDDVERIAVRVAELLRTDPPPEPARLADAAAVARLLSVDRDWVYAHASELGAIRLGGAHGRLRFDLRHIEQRLASPDRPPAPPPPRRRTALRTPATDVELLPYVELSSTPQQGGRAARQRPRP
jgi:hypothetical protein